MKRNLIITQDGQDFLLLYISISYSNAY